MVVSVLLMTPVRSFGELIQQALQETGLYRVYLVGEADEALEQIRTQDYPVAVLDFDLETNPSDLVEALYGLASDLRIIAIKDETDAKVSVMEDLRLAQHLDTPFYLPDLLDALDVVTADFQHIKDQSARDRPIRAFPSSFFESSDEYVRSESPEWLDDVSIAAIHLTRLSLESTAQAALITRNAQLWAYAGHLPHPAAEELAQFVGFYWHRDNGSDFTRFIRLDAVSEEYILYATGLGGDYVLALAFDIGIPFTKIHSQAKGLAKKLVNAPMEGAFIDEVSDQQRTQVESDVDSEEITAKVIPDDLLGDNGEEIVEFPEDWKPSQGVAEGRQAFFEELLSSVEFPEPDGKPVYTDDTSDDSTEKVVIPSELHQIGEVGDKIPNQSSDTQFNGDDDVQNEPRPTFHPSVIGQDDLESESQEGLMLNYLNETVATPLPDYLRDTVPTPIKRFGEKFLDGQTSDIKTFQDSAEYSELTYACVLAPKLLYHHLVGDLATFLNRCVLQVGKAFGWQLEHLAIRPNYLHWIIAIPPGSSPGYMVRIMRDHTSHRIFSQFPQYARENITGDFWAAGYLIVNGKYPLSHQLVEDFIEKIRKRQSQPQHHSLTDI